MSEAVARGPVPQGDRITGRAITIVLVSTVGTATYSFTWYSVTVALPHMQGTFSATTDQIAWVMIAFIIGSAMMTASVGWLATRFGRKQVYMLAISGYAVALLGAALSTTLEAEVFWRFAQGFCGAAMIPLGQTIAVNAFPPGRYGQATSLWAMGFVTANVIAPTAAGYLVEHFGWPWIFYVNIPVAVAVLVGAWHFIPATEKLPRRLDWIGFMTLLVAVSVLQLMLARGERLDWFDATEIVIEATVVAVFFYVCIAHTLTTAEPFLDRDIFATRNFVVGLVFVFTVGSVLFLPILLMPLMLQQIAGYSPIETGMLLMSRGVGSVAGLLFTTYVRDRYDLRPILCLGLLVTALSAWQVSTWTVEIQRSDVVIANLLQGLATGPVWAPMNGLTLSRLPRRVQNQGFALFYLSFDVGNAIGTAMMIGLLGRMSQVNHAILSEFVNPFNQALRYGLAASAWDLDKVSDLSALDAEVARQAAMIAYTNCFLVIAVLLVALIPAILLFRKPA
jgi:DHA2 family multidrug resistance protein